MRSGAQHCCTGRGGGLQRGGRHSGFPPDHSQTVPAEGDGLRRRLGEFRGAGGDVRRGQGACGLESSRRMDLGRGARRRQAKQVLKWLDLGKS